MDKAYLMMICLLFASFIGCIEEAEDNEDSEGDTSLIRHWNLEEVETGEVYTSNNYYDNLTLVVFCHTESPHCQGQTEALKEIYGNYSSSLNMFSIGGYTLENNTDGPEDLAEFKVEYSLEWPNLFDGTGKLAEEYGFNAYPSMTLIKNNETVYSHSGSLTYEQLSSEIDNNS